MKNKILSMILVIIICIMPVSVYATEQNRGNDRLNSYNGGVVAYDEQMIYHTYEGVYTIDSCDSAVCGPSTRTYSVKPGIFASRRDGAGEPVKISDDVNVSSFNIYKNTLYYVLKDEKEELWLKKVTLTAPYTVSVVKKLDFTPAYDFSLILVNGSFYYNVHVNDTIRNHDIYQMSLDGKKVKLLVKNGTGGFDVADKYLYYTTYDTIRRVEITGSKPSENVYSHNSGYKTYLQVYKNHLYFYIGTPSGFARVPIKKDVAPKEIEYLYTFNTPQDFMFREHFIVMNENQLVAMDAFGNKPFVIEKIPSKWEVTGSIDLSPVIYRVEDKLYSQYQLNLYKKNGQVSSKVTSNPSLMYQGYQMIKFKIDYHLVGTSAPAILIDNEVMVPLELLKQNMSAGIDWNSESIVANIQYGGQFYETIVGEKTAEKFKGHQVVTIFANGNKVNSKVPAVLLEGQPFIPIEAVAKAMGLRFQWDSKTRIANLSSF